MKKYDTPVISITVIKSEEIMLVSGALSTKASGAQSKIQKTAEIKF